MAHNESNSVPGDSFPGAGGSGQVTVQELTWALIDDHISGDEFQLLDSLLLSDDAARRDYLGCVQLHTDLMAHFAKPADKTSIGGSPVLGFLNGVIPPFDTHQPSQQ